MVKSDEEDDNSFMRANKRKKEDIIDEYPPSPWQDLLDALIELILERLHLPDYVRFAAVCKAWQSKQISHRLRFSPLPPPMSAPLPWLVPFIYHPSYETMECYSPLEKRMYHLTPSNTSRCMRVLTSCFGWLFVLEDIGDEAFPYAVQPLLYNPITNDRILLPRISRFRYRACHFAQLSTSPMDSHCTVLLVNGVNAYLYRLTACVRWVRFKSHPLKNSLAAVYCNGKFYCERFKKLYIVNPTLPTPTIDCFNMDIDESANYTRCCIVEYEGELFLCTWACLYIKSPKMSAKTDFEVFKVDLCKKRWNKVESIGSNRVIFVHNNRGLMLLLANNNIGFRHDCVYFSNDNQSGTVVSWNVYDLITKSLILEMPLSYDNPMKRSTHRDVWFLPALSSIKQTKAEADLKKK